MENEYRLLVKYLMVGLMQKNMPTWAKLHLIGIIINTISLISVGIALIFKD